MYNKILLAADGSKHSLRAADRAIALAKVNAQAKIEVLHVVDSKTSKAEAVKQIDEFGVLEKRKERFKDTVERADAAGVYYEMKLLRGDPASTIIDEANSNGYDIVIIGSRGLNAMQELMMGSVSYKVAKKAKCPVMIVK